MAAFGLGGTLLFRLSPYADVKTLLDDASLPEETITSPDRFAEVLETLGAAARFGAAIGTIIAAVLLALAWLRDRLAGAPRRADLSSRSS